MLNGERVVLAPLREADLPAFYEAHVDMRTRGAYFPLGVVSESTWRTRFAQNGLWERDEGTLLIRDLEGRIVGHIEFFPPVGYWDAYELSYQLYDPAAAGHGYTTEAVQLLVDYLFGAKKRHRIQLVIVPGNTASERIAENAASRTKESCGVPSSTTAATMTSRCSGCFVTIRDRGTVNASDAADPSSGPWC